MMSFVYLEKGLGVWGIFIKIIIKVNVIIAFRLILWIKKFQKCKSVPAL